jgi:hypothetical protein
MIHAVKKTLIIMFGLSIGALGGCATSAPSETDVRATEEALIEPGSQCVASFCGSDSECQSCPGSVGSCNGGICAYTETGGGGLGEGGYCNWAFCNTDLDCTAQCDGTSSPRCHHGLCAP